MIESLVTEKRNEKTYNLDQMDVLSLLKVMNEEDQSVPAAIQKVLPTIAAVVEVTVNRLQNGGRIIYIGAGTSGRLGVLDAAECPPTFGTTNEVIGLIAGGEAAFVKAIEGAEDSMTLAVENLKAVKLSAKDVVIGIAASGRTPYVIGGLEYAREIGAYAVAFSANPNAKISDHADIAIEVDCGPEILTGSTRLKAGTAQKLVLNMISTASMVGIGKVFGNLMVDVQPTNEKLVERSKHIVIEATGVSYEEAEKVLSAAKGKVKDAIVMILAKCNYDEAKARLKASNGFVRVAIK